MNVLILGAGQVGRTVLHSLAAEVNMDVTVVDVDQNALAEISNLYSCQTLLGHASSPDVLREAGIADCDAIVAVTASDEVNLVACQVALSLHDTPMRIARIRNLAYLQGNHTDLFSVGGIPVDEPISPELTVVQHLQNLISYQGSIYVIEFADGEVVMTCNRIEAQSDLVNVRARDFASASGGRAFLCGMVRDGNVIRSLDGATIQSNDLVFILGSKHTMRDMSRDVNGILKPYRQIVIGGGGHIGMRLARDIQDMPTRRSVKIIEADAHRAEQIAEELAAYSKVTVLSGDAASEDFLRANDINDSDLYCAVTNSDLVNIVSSLTAKRLNVKTVITLVQHVNYLESLIQAGIEIPISPQQTTANLIQGLVREKTLSAFRHLPLLKLDLLELKVQGNAETSRVVGKFPAQLTMPKGLHFACLLRGIDDAGDEDAPQLYPILADKSVQIAEDDRVIFISESKEATAAAEQLFRAKAFKLF